jgi:hypothetical protein
MPISVISSLGVMKCPFLDTAGGIAGKFYETDCVNLNFRKNLLHKGR